MKVSNYVLSVVGLSNALYFSTPGYADSFLCPSGGQIESLLQFRQDERKGKGLDTLNELIKNNGLIRLTQKNKEIGLFMEPSRGEYIEKTNKNEQIISSPTDLRNWYMHEELTNKKRKYYNFSQIKSKLQNQCSYKIDDGPTVEFRVFDMNEFNNGIVEITGDNHAVVNVHAVKNASDFRQNGNRLLGCDLTILPIGEMIKKNEQSGLVSGKNWNITNKQGEESHCMIEFRDINKPIYERTPIQVGLGFTKKSNEADAEIPAGKYLVSILCHNVDIKTSDKDNLGHEIDLLREFADKFEKINQEKFNQNVDQDMIVDLLRKINNIFLEAVSDNQVKDEIKKLDKMLNDFIKKIPDSFYKLTMKKTTHDQDKDKELFEKYEKIINSYKLNRKNKDNWKLAYENEFSICQFNKNIN